MKSISLGLFVACGAAVFSTSVRASIQADPCACTTETQWVTKAQSYGWGAVGYLYSFQAGQFRKFQNSGTILGVDPVASGVGATTDADEASQRSARSSSVQSGTTPTVAWKPVEARYQTYFSNLMDVRNFTGRPLSAINFHYQLPTSATDSHGNNVGSYNGYDIVNNGSHNNNLGDYLVEQRAAIFGNSDLAVIADKLAGLLQALDKVVTSGELLKVTVTVDFPDGSSMQFVDTGDGVIVRVKGSGRDRNNNTILDQNDINGRGNYEIAGADNSAWKQNMGHLGVVIPGNGVGGGVTTKTYSCSWNPSKGSLTCTLVQN